jgi:hypothetical protein
MNNANRTTVRISELEAKFVCVPSQRIRTWRATKSSLFWDITPCSQVKVTDVSEEHVASIFRVFCLDYS